MQLTESEQKKYERKAYAALDAIDHLVGKGLGGYKTENALAAIREIINEIQAAEIKARSKAKRGVGGYGGEG